MMDNVFMDNRTAEDTLPQSNEISIVMIVERVNVSFNQVSKDVDSFGPVDVNVLTVDLVTLKKLKKMHKINLQSEVMF